MITTDRPRLRYTWANSSKITLCRTEHRWFAIDPMRPLGYRTYGYDTYAEAHEQMLLLLADREYWAVGEQPPMPAFRELLQAAWA